MGRAWRNPMAQICRGTGKRSLIAPVTSRCSAVCSRFAPSTSRIRRRFRNLSKSLPYLRSSVQDNLADFAVRTLGARLTPKQLRGPWTYVGKRFDAIVSSGKMVVGHGLEITGLIIDADGDAPGYRIKVEDMHVPELKAQSA